MVFIDICVSYENQMKPLNIWQQEDSCLTLKEIINVATTLLSRVTKQKHAEIMHPLFTEPNQIDQKQTFVLKPMNCVWCVEKGPRYLLVFVEQL
jgi:hypothetical protein